MNRKASVAFNSNCQSIMGYFLTLQRNYVHCEKVTVSQKWHKIDTLLLPATNRREVSIHAISDDLEWPWMRFACCRAFKLQFDRHMCDVRSPSATAELLVRLANKRTNRQTDRHTDTQTGNSDVNNAASITATAKTQTPQPQPKPQPHVAAALSVPDNAQRMNQHYEALMYSQSLITANSHWTASQWWAAVVKPNS